MPRLSTDQHARLTTVVDRWLKKNYRMPVDLQALAQEIGISRFLLCRLYHERSGKTIRLKQREVRIACAARLLSRETAKVSEVARSVGYSSTSHFTKAFLEETGILPSVWRSRPRVLSLPETAGNLPAPGLTFVRLIGELPPEFSHASGHWDPAGNNLAEAGQGRRRPPRRAARGQEGSAFFD